MSNLSNLSRPQQSQEFICFLCQRVFSRKANLKRHQELNCQLSKQKTSNFENLLAGLVDEIRDLKTKTLTTDAIALFKQELEQRPQIVNTCNNLQVVCVRPDDNYLDLLTKKSELKVALEYIKDCALSCLAGDCRLLEKIYMAQGQPSIMYANKKRTQYVYYDENHRRVVETNPKNMAKKLANNLQRTYLKGVGFYKTDDYNQLIVDSSATQLPEIGDYDIHAWNAHIYQLSDERYQRKVLERLNIPFERTD